jgi:hypothetical protein
MPIPKPNENEKSKDFVARCMDNDVMKKEYPDNKQRVAICLGQTKSSLIEQVCKIIDYSESQRTDYADDLDNDGEELTTSNLVIPGDLDYVDVDELTEEYDLYTLSSEHQGRKVTLNKPFRTPNGPKKFSVYVKNEKGNVVKVNFGDPNMTIKKNIPERRKSFRARMRCDSPGPKWKARYWACKSW